MEPSSHEQFSGPEEPHRVALVSIAISLKRIADVVESGQFADSVCRAISEGIWSASQKG